MTGSASDKKAQQPHLYSKVQKKDLEKRFKDPADPRSTLDEANELRMAKDFQEAMKREESLGLNPDELAFYDALAINESAVRELGDNILKKIAQSNEPLRFVPSVTRSRCQVFAFRHPKHCRFEGNQVLIARLTASFGI
jgi:type I site-specific restriction-modification system R (restriction) subunit